jgi:hypothetical protein
VAVQSVDIAEGLSRDLCMEAVQPHGPFYGEIPKHVPAFDPRAGCLFCRHVVVGCNLFP